MSDIALTTLFTASGTALVALAGIAASVFGPAWRENRARRDEQKAAAERQRYDAAMNFIAAISRGAYVNTVADIAAYRAERTKFVATLRPGEGPLATYTSELATSMVGTPHDLAEKIDAASDKIFGYLRGEIPISAFSIGHAVGTTPDKQ